MDGIDIKIILVNPARPENIGFCARAMKTLGFTDLRLVLPAFPIMETQARKTAYGSHDILERITFHESLSDALSDVEFSIGTTSKKRTLRKETIHCADLPNIILAKKGSIGSIALVFGNEENGLSKQDIGLCDIVSTIPLDVTYPSLNLSQSVLVFLYELKRIPQGESAIKATDNNPGLFKSVIEESDTILKQLGIDDNPSYMRRIQDRIRLISTVDAHMMMTVIKKFKSKFL